MIAAKRFRLATLAIVVAACVFNAGQAQVATATAEKSIFQHLGTVEGKRLPHRGAVPGKLVPNTKKPTAELDEFGGYKKVRGQATGRFSLQQVDPGRWSFFTPEGNAFTVNGVNKVWPYDLDAGAFDEKFGGSTHRWAVQTAEFLDDLGFNTLGNNFDDAFLHPRVLQTPFMVAAKFSVWEEQTRYALDDYPDVWTEQFEADAKDEAQRIADRYGDNPYLVAIFVSNEMRHYLRNPDGSENRSAVHWKVLVDTEGDTPAKQEYIKLYRERYKDDIDALNAVYEPDPPLTSFEQLGEVGLGLYARFEDGIAEDEEEDGRRAFWDVTNWNAKIAGKYQEVAYRALKEKMPDVIVTSNRLTQGIYEDPYFEAIKNNIDVLAVNYWSLEPPSAWTLDRYHELAGVPILLTEHGYATLPCDLDEDGGHYPAVATDAERAEKHLEYRNAVLAYPYVLGSLYHQYADNPHEANPACDHTQWGLVSTEIEPYQEMIDAGREQWTDFNEVRWGSP